MQEEEEFEELSDEEKDHVLELIESGELDIKDVDPRDLPSRDRVTPTAFNNFGNYVILICTKSSTYLCIIKVMWPFSKFSNRDPRRILHNIFSIFEKSLKPIIPNFFYPSQIKQLNHSKTLLTLMESQMLDRA